MSEEETREAPYRGLVVRAASELSLPAKTLAKYKPTRTVLAPVLGLSIGAGSMGVVVVLAWFVRSPLVILAGMLLLLAATRMYQRRRATLVYRTIDEANGLIGRHKLDRAEALLDSVASPLWSGALIQAMVIHNRALIDLHRGNLQNAVTLLSQLVGTSGVRAELLPLHNLVHAHLALALALAGREKEARASLAAIDERGNATQRLLVQRGLTCATLRLGDVQETLDLYEHYWDDWEHHVPVASMRATALLRAFAVGEMAAGDATKEPEIQRWIAYADRPDRASVQYLLDHWPALRAFVESRDVAFR